MLQHEGIFPIARMAKVLEVSESGYHKWKKKLSAKLTEKEKEDMELAKEIHEIFTRSRGSFGSRKIVRILNKRRFKPVNHKRVERLMQEYGLFSKTRKRYMVTTDSSHRNEIADNLLNRSFRAAQPSERMVSDTTVVKTKQGDLYVAGILDLFGRMPVGLAMSQKNDTNLVLDALEDMMIRGKGHAGCFMHSDRGVTYTAKEYRLKLSQYDLLCSMSGKGDCWDNAPMESFWGKMKSEWLKKKYDTLEEAKRDVYEYVWSFYPKERPHASNGYLTPAEYCRTIKP